MKAINIPLIMLTQLQLASTLRYFPRRRFGVVSNYYRKDKLNDPGGAISTSEDSWEKWEFGNEKFIDKAEAEVPRTSFPSAHPSNVPWKDGEQNFSLALDQLRPFISDERWAKMQAVMGERTGRVRFVLEDPINPSNAWACLRTIDSFGVQYVDVVANPSNYIGRVLNPKFQRMNTAMGAQKWLDLSSHDNARTCIQDLKAGGWTILGTDLSEGAVPITDLDFNDMGPFAVVMGNEERGISEEMRNLCDHKVYLPMRGFAQSFSLSVGCAAIASHLNAVGALHANLDPAERERILFKWGLDSVVGSRHILKRAGFDIPLHNPPAAKILEFTAK